MPKRQIMSSPTAAVPAPDPLDTRENQLLAIARGLFARQGYERTALRDIADAAGITKAALYYYFPNKEALYERVVLESSPLDDLIFPTSSTMFSYFREFLKELSNTGSERSLMR